MRQQQAAAYAAVETERQVLAREEGRRASQRPVWQAPLLLNGQMRQRSPDRVVRLGRPRRRWVVFNLLRTGSSVLGLGRRSTSSCTWRSPPRSPSSWSRLLATPRTYARQHVGRRAGSGLSHADGRLFGGRKAPGVAPAACGCLLAQATAQARRAACKCSRCSALDM
jgi:hypothetical protein